jgi:hypothetical protein
VVQIWQMIAFEPILRVRVFLTMKKIIAVFLLTFCVSAGFSQDSVSVVQRSWAGGVCCSAGVDFTLNIPLEMGQQNIETLWLYVPGYKIRLSEKTLRESNKNCTATFGWSWNEYEAMNIPYIHYYGISDQDVIFTTDISKARIVLVFFNGNEKEVPVKFREEIVAYP